jgi:hypothetical protein
MVFLDDAKTNMWLELQRQRVIPFRRDTSSLILASSVRQQYSLGRSRDGFQEIARHAWRAVLAAGSTSSGLAQRCRIELLAAIDQNTRSATPNAALHFGRKWPLASFRGNAANGRFGGIATVFRGIATVAGGALDR